MQQTRHERRGIVAVLGDAVARGDIAPTGGANAWDGWDEVPGELLDKAFRENVEDFILDAASVKAIMLEAMGVIPHDVLG